MINITQLFCMVMVLSISVPNMLLAHPGGTDSSGCHNVSATGSRHCHNSGSGASTSESSSSGSSSSGNGSSGRSSSGGGSSGGDLLVGLVILGVGYWLFLPEKDEKNAAAHSLKETNGDFVFRYFQEDDLNHNRHLVNSDGKVYVGFKFGF